MLLPTSHQKSQTVSAVRRLQVSYEKIDCFIILFCYGNLVPKIFYVGKCWVCLDRNRIRKLNKPYSISISFHVCGKLKVHVAQVGSDTLVLLTISRNWPVFYSYFHLPLNHYLLFPCQPAIYQNRYKSEIDWLLPKILVSNIKTATNTTMDM